MPTLTRAFVALLLAALSAAPGLAQGPGAGPGPGPGPVPNPWVLNGSTLSYNNGCVTLPITVPGGCKGVGTINVEGAYINGQVLQATNMPPPPPEFFGTTVIVSGLIPTFPTNGLSSCVVVNGGGGYGSTPAATLYGGVTNGGTGGGVVAPHVSGGVVDSCAATTPGSYSYLPQVVVAGGGGSGALLAVTVDLQTFSTSAGVIQVGGARVTVPAYTHTYLASGAGSNGAYCDFVNTTTGGWNTVAAGVGNNGCFTPPAGQALLRVVYTQAGVTGTFPTGVTGIQYFMGRPALWQLFATNSKDFPTSTTELPGGNQAQTNFPCMMGRYGGGASAGGNGREGNCQVNGHYFVMLDQDVEPIQYNTTLDAGPIVDYQRVNFGRAGEAGDYLLQLNSRGMIGNAAGTSNYSTLLTRIISPGTVAHGYADVQGGLDVYTSGPDNGFTSTSGVARFTFEGGLHAAQYGGNNCGTVPAPSGPPNIVDQGSSTINICGSGTNNAGKANGYYLDNSVVLQVSRWTMYGAGSGSNFLASDQGGTVGLGYALPFALTSYSNSLVISPLQDSTAIVGVYNRGASASAGAGLVLNTGTTNSNLQLVLQDNGGAPAVAFYAGSGALSIALNSRFGSYVWSSTSGSQWAALSSGTLTLGLTGTTLGSVVLSGSSTGAISVRPQAAAGTYNFNMPTTAGTSGYLLTSAGGGSSPMTWTAPGAVALTVGSNPINGGVTNQLLYDNGGVLGEVTKGNSCVYGTNGTGVPACLGTLPFTVPASTGGTGQVTLTANAFLTGNGTSAINQVAITGLVLGNGASAPAAYAGANCTNQVVTAVNASGALTCVSITNAYLAAGSFTSITGVGTLTAGTWNATVVGATYGGTGVNNGSSTITLGASLTTTGAGAPTLAFTGTARVYTFPDFNTTFVGTGGATVNQNALGNPTGTNSLVGVMAGVGSSCAITPRASSRIKVEIYGAMNNNTGGDGAQVTVKFGTGTAPTNGAASTGTVASSAITINSVTANMFVPFNAPAIITGLTPGTAYWFDLLQNAVTGGSMQIANAGCDAFEF